MKTKLWLLTLAVSLGTSLGFTAVAHAQSAITERQIAEALEEANDAEIDLADIAEDDAERKEVKDFAKEMIDSHKMNNKEMKTVLKKSKIKPEKSELSKMIKTDYKNKKDLLKKQKDLAFDKMYMDQQISMHTQLLNDIETKFIPATHNADFKTHLEATKVHVKAHLEKAKAIQARL